MPQSVVFIGKNQKRLICIFLKHIMVFPHNCFFEERKLMCFNVMQVQKYHRLLYNTKWVKRDVILRKQASGFQIHCLMETINV